MSKRRAVLAGVLGIVYPGLGHLYLRRWLRAVAWVGLAIATAAFVVPDSVIEAVRTGGIDAAFRASRSLPRRTILSVLFVRVLAAIDAVLVALGRVPGTTEPADGPTCPNCGRELDGDLDFCYWCTTRLDSTREESRLE